MEMIKPIIAESILPYLNEISTQLWSGHASIMVGAGFSKNAKSIGKTTKEFPDWNQLGDIFYKKIHGDKPKKDNRYLNVLKLADEVQAAFGRPTLDKLLQNNIPDLNYQPSDLHIKLLKLPWSDIFTTNYDTLLERARDFVIERRYDLVINKEDLPNSNQPRIIKLHGSFPSNRPFIITEEDYRRYPSDFAPFVNTVQQSLLENALCLIGFSGDDPNFLRWIGWIRDNIGNQNSPKMYLIGILNLSDAQKKLLEQRNIIVINMADCSDIDDNDYILSIERFLNYLNLKGEDNNKLNWPKDLTLMHPDLNSKTAKSDQIKKVLKEWEKQRIDYPGWVILPEDRRNLLWIYTES